MNFKKNRGFTLIELLVVIAIIGILSSVVLASLNTARDKGRDAATQSAMQTVRVQAELYYETNGGDYGTDGNAVCAADMFADPTVAAAIAQITTTSGVAPVCNIDTVGGVAGQGWAMTANLRDPAVAGNQWCVDYTGQAVETAAALPINIIVCP